MRHPARGLLLPAWICALALAGLAPAGAASAEEVARAPHEVEVIVFRQWEAGGRNAERWPTRARLPYAERWRVPTGCGAGAPAKERPRSEAEAAEEAPGPLRCLPADQRQLGPQWEALAASRHYRPLYHIAWEQPGVPRDEAIAVPVPSYWQPPQAPEATDLVAEPPPYQPPVFGLIRVHQDRFFRAEVELRLRRQATGWDSSASTRLRAPLHRLSQQRRLRSDELHYLDHPALGVLITVREAASTDGPE